MDQFIKQAHQQIANLVPYQGGMSANSLKNIDKDSIIKLASNENPLGASPMAKQAILDYIDQSYLYPETMQQTLDALAQHLKIDAKQLILGNGSENIIAMLIQAFNRPENHYLIPQYAFSAYSINAKAHNAAFKIIPTPNYRLDINKLLELANQSTAMIFIDNPGNPTGHYLTHQEISYLLENLSPTTLLIIDEAYYEYTAKISNYPDSLTLQKQHSNLVILRTFSKIYGLAGLRIGYGICHPDIINVLNRIRFPFNVASLSLIGAAAALKDDSFVKHSFDVNQKGIIDFKACFNELKLDILPSIGNFITVDFKDKSNDFFKFMLNKGVILRPLTPYQLPNHIRISTGTDKQNTFAIEKIYQYFGN